MIVSLNFIELFAGWVEIEPTGITFTVTHSLPEETFPAVFGIRLSCSVVQKSNNFRRRQTCTILLSIGKLSCLTQRAVKIAARIVLFAAHIS